MGKIRKKDAKVGKKKGENTTELVYLDSSTLGKKLCCVEFHIA